MARGRWMGMSVGLAVLSSLALSASALCRETEDQLLQRIQNEPNPVKKAKDEIKLSSLRFIQIRDDYTDGRTDSGAKLLGTFMGDMKNSWKLLQDSGRKAWKQPEGFRELEISLREDVRLLQDLARSVSYFDRGPLLNAAEQLDHMRDDVLRAQFPGGNPKTIKNATAPPPTQGSGGSSDQQ